MKRIALSFFCATVMYSGLSHAMSKAEERRLNVLMSERVAVEAELQGELNNYAAEKNKQEAYKRITTLRRNLSDLDTEIGNTGSVPEVRGLEAPRARPVTDVPQTVKAVEVSAQPKEPSREQFKEPAREAARESFKEVRREVGREASNRGHEPWDVFRNF